MGKSLRRVQRTLNARIKACYEARKIIAARQPKLASVIEKQSKTPGSMKL